MNAENSKIAGAILEHIRSADTIIICSHVFPDGDAFGSVFALAAVLRHNFPEKSVLVSTDTATGPAFLPRSDSIGDSRFPGSLVIAVDTANAERVYERRWNRGRYVIKIDHHPFHEHFGHIEWIDTSYPSCCEMILDLCSSGNLGIPEEGARMLFFGMVTDTGRFRFPGVGEETFRRAAGLCALGVEPPEIYEAIYGESEQVLRFRGYAYRHFELTEEGFACLRLEAKTLEEYGLTAVRASRMVNLLSELEGVEIWAFFCEDRKTADIKIELRSRATPVNTIAAAYGGGGHRLAAGARADDWKTVDSMIADIREELRQTP